MWIEYIKTNELLSEKVNNTKIDLATLSATIDTSKLNEDNILISDSYDMEEYLNNSDVWKILVNTWSEFLKTRLA